MAVAERPFRPEFKVAFDALARDETDRPGQRPNARVQASPPAARDLLAGLTVGALALPSGIAYAEVGEYHRLRPLCPQQDGGIGA